MNTQRKEKKRKEEKKKKNPILDFPFKLKSRFD